MFQYSRRVFVFHFPAWYVEIKFHDVLIDILTKVKLWIKKESFFGHFLHLNSTVSGCWLLPNSKQTSLAGFSPDLTVGKQINQCWISVFFGMVAEAFCFFEAFEAFWVTCRLILYPPSPSYPCIPSTYSEYIVCRGKAWHIKSGTLLLYSSFFHSDSLSCFCQKKPPEGPGIAAGQSGCGDERQGWGHEAEEETRGGHQWTGAPGGLAHQEQCRNHEERQENAAAD